MTLKGMNERQWTDLAKRVSSGIAVDVDAEQVEQIGLKPQAIRIRAGLATHTDAVLIHLQAQLRLHGLADEQRQQEGRAA